MWKLSKIAVWAVSAAILSTAASAEVSLDLNPAPGDQKERDGMVKPGDTFSVELIAQGGADGMIGFKAELKFDTNQVQFKGFNAGGLMSGAMSMPPKSGPSGVEVNAAIMGGGGAGGDSGSLGQLLFQAGPNFTGTPIEIASASFGSTAGIRPVGVTNGVRVANPDAPPTDPAPGQNFQNPPPGPPPTGFTNQGPQGRGPRNAQMGRGPQDGHMGRGPQDGHMGRGPQDGHMGRGPQDGHMGGPDHTGGPDKDMSPEDVIAKLPEALQPAFRQTMEAERNSERTHLEAELSMLRSVRNTLEQTKQFLSTASDADRETVGKALMYFHQMDRDDHDPMRGPGGPGMGHPPGMGPGAPPGGPGMGMPGSPGEMVNRMIQETEREIQHLEQELQNL